MPQASDEHGAFKRLLTRLVRVAKDEIDAEEKKEHAQPKSRKSVPAGQIVPQSKIPSR